MKLKSILTSAIAAVALGTAAIAADIKVGFVMLAQWATAAGHTNTIKAVKLWSKHSAIASKRSIKKAFQRVLTLNVMTQMALQGADLIITSSATWIQRSTLPRNSQKI